MAIHYNLSKIYAIADDDQEFVLQIVNLFFDEVLPDLNYVKEGIKEEDYSKAYAYSHKCKPTLDLLSLDEAKEEIIQIENWTKEKGRKKDIIEVYKSMQNRIDLAAAEIKKDFNL